MLVKRHAIIIICSIIVSLSQGICVFAGQECFPDCEFCCNFPGNPEVKKAYVGESIIIQKQFWASDYTLLKAECITNIPSSDEEIVRILNNQARLSNIMTPAISVEKMGRVKIGVYSGNMNAAGHALKFHGRMIIGKRSTLHLIVIEELGRFPTKEAVNFLDSFIQR